ncbi:MAG TPA: MXAN_6640 family putative metalloprotease [Actinomycetota bacterium]|nr:MXAN_6640 family putative metalloprotease [Actinomycetota bacterium]
MKRIAVVLALLALAAAAVAPASAGKRGSSLRRGLDLSLDAPVHIPDHGAHLDEDTAALSSVTTDRLSRSLTSGRISPAKFALERAEATLDGDFDGHLSLVLTDLALRVRELSGADRERAQAILARPTDPDTDANINRVSYRDADVNASCSAHFCIHWTSTGRHAVAQTDANSNTTPDYVETVQVEMENVWAAIVDGHGFKAPKSDLTSENTVSGPDAGKLDVYLVEAGSDGVYGYCTTDDPNLLDPSLGYEYFDGSAYCALDDDFAPSQFGGAPAEESLRVTAAHEFFHAVQLSYAAGHDTWMSEGTATLMEDVVHDDVDDNYQYLSVSAMRTLNGRTTVPLDAGIAPYHYGAWLWWRFLVELEETGGLPIIRETWEYAALDGPGADGLVSTFAIRKALADHNVSFAGAKAFFSVVNYLPEGFYEEGAAYRAEMNGKRPTPMATFTLGGTKKGTGLRVAKLDHLSAGYVVFKPGAGVTKLRAGVDLPAGATSPSAAVLVLYTDGTVERASIPVNGTGVGALKGIPFRKGEVASVVLVLDNASTRFKACFQRSTPWTCSGIPRDDALPFQLSGTAS